MLAIAAASATVPSMSIIHRERTAHGVIVLVAPAPGPVTVEAWIGGGSGDEAVGQHGLAHLAEHVALAASESAADALRGHGGGGLDGWVTPDATVFRAVAGPGALLPAIEAVAAAAGATVAPPALVDAEAARVAVEVDGWSPRARLAALAWGAQPVAARAGAAEVEAWWRASYDPRRTTVAVTGGDAAEVGRAIAARWRRPGGDSAHPRRDRAALRGARSQPEVRLHGWWAIAANLTSASTSDLAALALVATAARRSPPWPGMEWAEVVALRDRAAWIATGRGAPPDTAALAAGLEAAGTIDGAALAWARAAVRVPLAGVDGLASELAAGQHLHGDPRWAAVLRRAVAAVTRDTVAAAVSRHLVGQARLIGPPPAARRAGPSPRRVRPRAATSKRATLAGGTRVVAVRAPGATGVAIRVAWTGGFADEGPAERGVVALLAAVAPQTCDALDAAAETSALGGELAGVAGRWSFGLRSRWPRASWRDGLALVVSCATAATLDAAIVTRERARLVELAHGVAGSPSRTAFLAYLEARWDTDPLGRDPLAAPGELAALTPGHLERWRRERYPPGAAVVVVIGDLDPDDMIDAVRAGFAAAVPAAAPSSPVAPPATFARAVAPLAPLPEARQIFVDGPAGTAAVVIGLPGLAATASDRPYLDGLVAILSAPGGRLRRAVAAAGARSLRVAVVDGPSGGYVALELEGPPPLDAAVAAAAAEVRALAGDGPTAAELVVARAALVAAGDPLRRADAISRAELAGAPLPAALVVDDDAVHRVAAAVLRWDDAVVATVRPPDMTPGAYQRAIKRLPPRRVPRRRGPRRR